jgi:hypothetical protein
MASIFSPPVLIIHLVCGFYEEDYEPGSQVGMAVEGRRALG